MFFVRSRSYKPRADSVVIDKSHPLSKNLEFASLFEGGVPFDLVKGYPSTPNNSPQQLAVAEPGYGVGGDFPAGGTAFHIYNGTVVDTPYLAAITVVWAGVVRTGSAFRAFVDKAAGSGSAQNPFDFRTDNSATPLLHLVRGSANFIDWTGPATTLGVNKQYGATSLGTGSTTSDVTFYVNGVGSTSTAVSGSGITPWTGSNTPIQIGRRGDGATQMDGVCLYCYVWSRVLNANEMLWLSREPYAFMRPKHNTILGRPSAATTIFRRTLFQLGTRAGSRQAAGL